MNKLPILFYVIILTAISQELKAQSIERSAIVSAAHRQEVGAISFEGSVGQVFIGADSFEGISAGFEQPQPVLKVVYTLAPQSCQLGGNIILTASVLSECMGAPQFFIDDIEVEVESLVLNQGFYQLRVEADNYCPFEVELEVDPESVFGVCELEFYNAIFPDSETENRQWIIENINQPRFSNNEVTIYNRWGVEVWYGRGYDNQNVVFRGISADGDNLSDATYYYVVAVNEELFKGYLEVLR